MRRRTVPNQVIECAARHLPRDLLSNNALGCRRQHVLNARCHAGLFRRDMALRSAHVASRDAYDERSPAARVAADGVRIMIFAVGAGL
jgi:hypothetical protein